MSRTIGRFTDSTFGERLAQRKRTKRRIWVKVNVEPQSKKRRDTDKPDEIFHKAVVRALEQRNRRLPFRVPVAIRMHFQVGIEKAAPQIDKLPKHYLDLLQAQREQGVAGSPKLLLQDDNLVKALVCTSSLATSPGSKPHVFFEISTLKDFVQELLLYDRIVNRYGERVPEDVRRLFGSPFSDDLRNTGAIREYVQSRQQRDSLKGFYKNFADMMLPSRQEAAQDELLRLREPKPVQFAKIYEELLNRKYRFPDLHQSVAKMIRQVFRVGIATVDLGPPATQKGQSDEFKGRVQKALVKMRENYPILDPLLTTVGITVIYVPPASGQKIDLDNLAMRVIPYVRIELKPPATLLHALQHYKPGAIDDNMTARLKELHRVERNQVTRYQVFQIPRLDDDPPEGNVRMMLHGRNEFEDPWATCRAALDSWAQLPLDTEH